MQSKICATAAKFETELWDCIFRDFSDPSGASVAYKLIRKPKENLESLLQRKMMQSADTVPVVNTSTASDTHCETGNETVMTDPTDQIRFVDEEADVWQQHWKSG